MKTSILAGFIALAVVAAPASAASAPRPTKAIGIASCGGSATVTNSGTTCTAVDRNCAAVERGHVTCTTGGSTTTVYCPKSCYCGDVCVCGVPCTEPCDVGGFVQECGSWGICATSCYCGGECLTTGDPRERSGSSEGQSSCGAPAPADPLLAKIFG